VDVRAAGGCAPLICCPTDVALMTAGVEELTVSIPCARFDLSGAFFMLHFQQKKPGFSILKENSLLIYAHKADDHPPRLAAGLSRAASGSNGINENDTRSKQDHVENRL